MILLWYFEICNSLKVPKNSKDLHVHICCSSLDYNRSRETSKRDCSLLGSIHSFSRPVKITSALDWVSLLVRSRLSTLIAPGNMFIAFWFAKGRKTTTHFCHHLCFDQWFQGSITERVFPSHCSMNYVMVNSSLVLTIFATFASSSLGS